MDAEHGLHSTKNLLLHYFYFNYNIFLTICKRVGAKDTEEGDRNRKIIYDMYDDFWIHKLPMEEFIRKHHGLTTDDIMASEHNIAYTNIRCRNVASEVRKRLDIRDKYVVGDMLISRKWVEAPRINVNLRYCITLTYRTYQIKKINLTCLKMM